MSVQQWKCKDSILHIGQRSLVMGIVNITPDSFSDGGLYLETDAAVAHALQLVHEGADLIDIGGESSRPGADTIPCELELQRVIPTIRALAQQTQVPISVDTTKAEVARQALRAGAQIVNDITGLQDLEMRHVVREYGAGVILMHMQGNPRTMQINPCYDNLFSQIEDFFCERMNMAQAAGISTDQICLDPGLGFGKNHEHNYMLLRNLRYFQKLGRPVCLGVSRKGFIGTVTGRPRPERLAGSLALACHALADKAAQILRVHDVAAHRDAVLIMEALAGAGLPAER